MTEKVLYSVNGLFDTADEIIEAAEKVSAKGYTKYDVHTPYPVHGMDKAMKLPPSKLGYAALVFGLSGTITALSLMYWMMAVDYPNVIGGKPFFALPAFIPITFEVTVLAASVATVLTMLFVFFKFPNNSHPLHGTNYMKAVSSDKYGITILADDPKFDEKEVNNFLAEIGAKVVEPIFWDNEEINTKHKIFEPKYIALLAVLVVVTSGAAYFGLNKLMYMKPFSWMMIQNKTIAQQTSSFFEDGVGMRTPVEGTVARGFIPYPYKDQPELAAKNLVNPLLPSKENLAKGEKKYNTYCSPCHGYHAEGDSRLRGRFPNPPSLHSQKVREWSDGRIYHVIMEGQNVMPSYASQMTEDERWATILYIRALQRSLNAKETDLK